MPPLRRQLAVTTVERVPVVARGDLRTSARSASCWGRQSLSTSSASTRGECATKNRAAEGDIAGLFERVLAQAKAQQLWFTEHFTSMAP